MQLKKGQIIEIEIEKLAFGGAGIGKFENRPVFIKQTIPGDLVKASLRKIKEKYMEAQLEEIIKKSKSRVDAKCPHFDKCGGCQFQSMPYDMQLSIKKQHVIDSFERIGKISNPPVKEVIGCKDPYFYRNKMEFSFGFDENMEFALGLHLPGRRYDILDLDQCYLQSEFSTEIVNTVRDFCLKHNWEPRKYSAETGYLKSLFIREGKRTGEVMINLVTSDEVPDSFKEELKYFCVELLKLNSRNIEGEKKISSIYWSRKIARRGIPSRIEETHLYGKKTLTEKMVLSNGDELCFDISPQAFFQVNTFQAEILYSQIVELVAKDSHQHAFDLFCGTGTIGLFLAKHVENVLGVELNQSAIDSAKVNATRNNIFNVDFFVGSVVKVLQNVRDRPSLIVVDPPRAGLTQKLISKISQFDSSKVIYVSCNPATLARDCNWFSEYGYKLKSAQPVDMFPHTYHIENVCLLER
ncbi:23S rRNA (uracil(1939)-C(5))-methyltransferase RlmD [Patescibacteria group bacterium]